MAVQRIAWSRLQIQNRFHFFESLKLYFTFGKRRQQPQSYQFQLHLESTKENISPVKLNWWIKSDKIVRLQIISYRLHATKHRPYRVMMCKSNDLWVVVKTKLQKSPNAMFLLRWEMFISVCLLVGVWLCACVCALGKRHITSVKWIVFWIFMFTNVVAIAR